MMFVHGCRKALCVGALAWLAGCGVAGQEELREWMDQERRNMRPTIQDIPPPRQFEPFVYNQQGQVDPFDVRKMELALQKLAASSGRGKRPDMERRRQPMEAFPLDTIRMVGTLMQQGRRIALLQVDRAVYQVKVGEYVGQNFGQVTQITETEMTLKETVQDAAGDWVERVSSLQLQEIKK